MTIQEWNQLQRGDLLETTKKLLVVGQVMTGKTEAKLVTLHWVNYDGVQVVTIADFKTKDYGTYAAAGRLDQNARLTTGEPFWAELQTVPTQIEQVPTTAPRRGRLARSLRAAADAFTGEWAK